MLDLNIIVFTLLLFDTSNMYILLYFYWFIYIRNKTPHSKNVLDLLIAAHKKTCSVFPISLK